MPVKSLIRFKINKRISFLLPASIVIIVFLLLHVINFIRLKNNAFEDSAQALIERSRLIKEQARPDYQLQFLDRLPLHSNNGDFFRLDDLLNQALVRGKPSFPVKEDFSGVIYAFEFNEPDKPGLSLVLGKSVSSVESGLLRVVRDKYDYLANDIPIQIPKDDIADIVIRARADKGSRMMFGWQGVAGGPNVWDHSIRIDLIADKKFHKYVINAKNIFKQGLKPGEKINKVFLCPSNFDESAAEIDYIRFISKFAKYSERSHGTSYETIGGEMRGVLYMLPGYTLEYNLLVPKKSPKLDFGTGILIENAPVNFEICIFDDHRVKKVYTGVMTRSDKWQDVRLDLSPWAGKQVKILLHVSGSDQSVAFWSNPLIYSDPEKRFNVIIIIEDALRPDHLSSYGYELPTSPVKDKLMKKSGIVFLNAVSQATKTRPSVPSLMTSLLPTVTGVWDFFDMLNDNYLTIAEIMRVQGFVTASFIQNDNAGASNGLHQGFSQVFNAEILGDKTEDMFGDHLSAWIDRHSSQNFFLYLHILDPHGPYDPPPPYGSWFRATQPKGKQVSRNSNFDPDWVKHPTIVGRRLRYDFEIQHNDSQIPKLLEKLEALNLYQNTLLVFTSDHAEHLGEHGRFWNFRKPYWGHRPPGYLQVIGVPLMLSFPSRFKQYRRITQTVQLIDLMPTILELAGIDKKDLLQQGDSLVDLIEGRNLSYWEDRICVSEEPTYSLKDKPHIVGSLFFKEWHLLCSNNLFPLNLLKRKIRYLPPLLTMKVFDFRNDREEMHSILSFTPDLYVKYKFVKIMREIQSNGMAAWKKWTAKDQEETYKLDPDDLERLRGLGYVR